MSQPIVVPQQVLNKLVGDEKVLFIGNYDRSKINLQQINPSNASMGTVSSSVSINPEGYNLLNFVTYVVTDNSNPVYFVDETYTTSSWNISPVLPNRTKVGQIQWSGLYNNEQRTNITSPGVLRFMVTGNDGIFANVTAVVINFLDDLTRIIYYVGN
jgi:hypothetical protein